MELNKLNDTEKKKLNPVPFLIGALLLVVLAVLYYNTPLSKSKDDASPSPAASDKTPEPTVTAVAEKKDEITTITVEEVKAVLKEASDLITSRYYYTNAADFDSVLDWFGSGIENPFTRSKGYILYDGIVSVGIDLEDIEYDVDNLQKIITVHLPEEKVLAHEIDDSSVETDTRESIFNSLDGEYYARLIDGLKKSTEKKVLGNEEYMKQVRSNTQLVITNFFAASEATARYLIQFD